MKRRGFLGFMGGAAVAGPTAAKSVVGELPKSLGIGVPYGSMSGYGSTAVCSSSEGDWRLGEVARLKRILSGDLTDEEKENRRRSRLYRQEAIISQNVTSLVSVSSVARMRIYHRDMERHNERVERSECRSNLFRLLKEIG
jgi:hypothetical protein